MKHWLSFTNVRSVILAVSLTLVFLVGCDDDGRYPSSLRYPERTDLLVVGGLTEINDLPAPPGKLEEYVRNAAENKRFDWVDPLGKDKDGAPLISTEQRDELRRTLLEVFGTPASPSVEPRQPLAEFTDALQEQLSNSELTQDDVDVLFIDSESWDKYVGHPLRTLARGSELYRRHCLHCHGVAGDGRGPTGAWVDPHPRDYRQGQFKFLSTNLTEVNRGKPRKADLIRTLEKGIDGTSMPAFGLLPRRELEELASYVIHLSLRGQVEFETIKALANKSISEDKDAVRDFVYQQTAIYTAEWAKINKMEPNAPPAYPYDDNDKEQLAESIRRGHHLFLNKGICITCHYDYGRQSNNRYDAWGTMVKPRNLTDGNYRGGHRPIDLYWRISGGIPPSQMPSFELKSEVEQKEVWDLVNFVQAMPYPAMLPPDVREKIYPTPQAKQQASANR